MKAIFRRSSPLAASVRELERADLHRLREYIGRDPVGCAFFEDRLAAAGHAGRTSHNARFYGLFVSPRGDIVGPEILAGVVFAGVNVVPHGPWATTPMAVRLLVDRLYDERAQQPASIYGPAQSVIAFADEFERRGIRPSDVRRHQPFLVVDRARFEETRRYWPQALPPLSVSRLEDFDVLFPASVAMFTEEVGYSPIEDTRRNGRDISPDADAYAERVRQLIRQGDSYSHLEGGRVVFKAEFSAVTEATASVQGVWLAPEDRGRGLSSAYMRALVEAGLERSESVSLYANGYNYAALGAYSRAGFEQRGTFATVMY